MKKFLMVFLLLPFAAFAADAPMPPAPTAPAAMPEAIKVVQKDSLFFSNNEIASIMRANQGFIAPVAAFDPKNQSDRPADPGPRTLALSGIVYQSPHEWTIWLNNQRITPKNIPDHIMGVTVSKDLVHLRYMDIANQRIVNLTLRAHQTYFLDTDTIVSGT